MATEAHENVDYRLLNSLSKLVICSPCLQRGTVTPVPQIITPERKITNVCTHCRDHQRPPRTHVKFGTLLPFRRK